MKPQHEYLDLVLGMIGATVTIGVIYLLVLIIKAKLQ